jgi:DNA-binding NtrC family response regulator
MERAAIIAGEGTIQMAHLPINLQPKAQAAAAASGGSLATALEPVILDNADAIRISIGTTVEQAEKDLILRTLEYTRNNKTRAAEILGISLKTLHNKLKEYGARDVGI